MTRSPLNFRLSAARRALAATFISTATVVRRSQVVDSTGGYVDTYTEVATYPCWFVRYPITPVERENTISVVTVAFWRFLFAFDADVQASDRLTVDGRLFEVVDASKPSLELALEVLCQEIT